MSALLTSLPGDIPGLLRRWSPVAWPGEQRGSTRRGAYVGPDGACHVVYQDSSDEEHLSKYVTEPIDRLDYPPDLDLTDLTGRAHAAWWLTGRLDQHPGDEVWQAICRATTGIDMTPTQIDTLARLVLRLAGRAA